MIVFISKRLTKIDKIGKAVYIQAMSKRNSPEAVKERTNPLIRHGRHCTFLMHTHLVFVTKYRRFSLSNRVLDHLEEIFKSVCQDFEAELVEFEGEGDHVHLLINYPPKVSVAKMVNSLKGVSSRYIRQANYPEVRKKLWGGSLWSPSYFAGSCGGASIDIIRKYIEQQERPS